MKDEISELDIRKALIEQLTENESKTTKKLKRKKNEKSEHDSHKTKKRKTSKAKINNSSLTSEEANIKTKSPKDKVQQTRDPQRPLRPPPKVVVFEEPGNSKEKDGSQNSNTSKQHINDDDDDFLEIARDVREFGMTGFSKKERRKYEQQKAQALGAKAPKGPKMPYNIYMSHMRVQKRKEERRHQLQQAMGMGAKKSTKQKQEKGASSNESSGWWTDKSSTGLDMSIGKYKKGVQTLSKDDIKKIKSKKR